MIDHVLLIGREKDFVNYEGNFPFFFFFFFTSLHKKYFKVERKFHNIGMTSNIKHV